MPAVAVDVLAKVPAPYDMELVKMRYPVKWNESMNTVLTQELLRFNNLIRIVLSLLKSVIKAVKVLFSPAPIMWFKAAPSASSRATSARCTRPASARACCPPPATPPTSSCSSSCLPM